MRSRPFPLLLALSLLAAPTAAIAQDALVLSGGGSRGLAHVGVFQGLAELGYDPELVVGTSMGAVVGALYAAGYTPEEIRERILDVGWGGLFAPTTVVLGPERAVRLPLVTFDLDVDRLRVSRGLLGQWRINRALARLLFDANARSRGNFDRLARRFRAVAADLRTGEAVVLEHGDLARVVRASMSVPGFFAPVVLDGRVLVDGGIANNLPLDVARALGAQRVIAVDVGRTSEEIGSQAPLAVIQRALDLMQDNTQRDPVPPDLLVLPDIPAGFTGAAFPDDPTFLLDLGLAAARRDLPPLADAPGGDGRPLPALPEWFAEVIVDAPDLALARLAHHILADVAPGPFDHDAVLSAIDRLYATGLVEGAWPRVEEPPDEGPHPALVVRLDGPPVLSLSAAAGYGLDRGGRAWASLDRYSAVAGRPAIFTAATQVGGIERWGALSARVYTHSRPALAVSAGTHLQERDVRFYEEDVVGVKEALRAGGWLGVELPRVLRERLGTAAVVAEWVDVEDGPSALAVGPLVRATSLGTDMLVVGVPLLLEGERRWGAVSYSRVALSGSLPLTLGPLHLAPLADARGVSPGAPDDVRPALGDQHAIPGLRWGEVRGRARVVVGLDAALPVMTGFVRVGLRAGAVSEQLEAWRDEWHAGARASVFWRGPFGVVDAGYGISTRGEGRIEVRVGRQF